MKKLSIYLMLTFAGLFITACGLEDNEFANLKTAEAEGSVVVPGFTAGQVGQIDLNTVEVSSAQDVKAFTVTETALPEGVELTKAEIVFEDGTVMSATADGKVSGETLSAYIASIYGRRPEARTVAGNVYLYAMQNGAAVKIDAGKVSFQVVPKAPVIEEAYYITGNINGWDNTDVTYELTNGGGDVYEDPVFKIRIAAGLAEGNYEFKLTPKSGLGGDWSKCLTASATAGRFEFDNAGGNIVIEAVEGAKFYDLSFDLLNQTYTISAVKFDSYIYEAGVNNEWGKYEQALYCSDGEGTYTGFFYAQDADWSGGMGAFKFTGAFNDWSHGNYGSGSSTDEGGTMIDSNDSGNLLATPGFYRADVNMVDMTYKLTRINSIFVVGSAVNNDWDNGVALTYNAEKRCWEVDTEIGEGVIKFKGNGTWDNQDGNWGGTLDNIINGSNDNIPVSVTGKVHIEFYPTCDTKSYAVVTAL